MAGGGKVNDGGSAPLGVETVGSAATGILLEGPLGPDPGGQVCNEGTLRGGEGTMASMAQKTSISRLAADSLAEGCLAVPWARW